MRGIGTDIIEIDRIERAMLSQRFMLRVYTELERAYIEAASMPKQSAAGIFCVKEAVAKALGTGFGSGLSFLDIEVMHSSMGAPYVKLRGHEEPSIGIAISHCRAYATATAIIWEK